MEKAKERESLYIPTHHSFEEHTQHTVVCIVLFDMPSACIKLLYVFFCSEAPPLDLKFVIRFCCIIAGTKRFIHIERERIFIQYKK